MFLATQFIVYLFLTSLSLSTSCGLYLSPLSPLSVNHMDMDVTFQGPHPNAPNKTQPARLIRAGILAGFTCAGLVLTVTAALITLSCPESSVLLLIAAIPSLCNFPYLLHLWFLYLVDCLT